MCPVRAGGAVGLNGHHESDGLDMHSDRVKISRAAEVSEAPAIAIANRLATCPDSASAGPRKLDIALVNCYIELIHCPTATRQCCLLPVSTRGVGSILSTGVRFGRSPTYLFFKGPASNQSLHSATVGWRVTYPASPPEPNRTAYLIRLLS